ncbi:MAG: two-component system chemotaxis family response regulator WspR [Bradymonadia bacterium]|jgi:two-component system chemotaxis family response regulator WspR
MRVLYMEDDAAISRQVQQRLEAAGLRVDVASNGESGLIMHRVRRYDVLIVAQELPVRTGLDVVWTLSAKAELPPTIMVAKQGDAEVAVQALKLGVGDYLLKDEDARFIDVLPGCLQQIIRERRERDEKDGLIASFKANQSQLEESNLALLRLAAMDGLTGIANRRLFDEVLEREWRRGLEAGTPVSLILADVDRFKDFNDIYGHLAGDDCLKHVAKVIGRGPMTRQDLAARYGGEEFTVILTSRVDAEATAIADQLRRGVESLNIRHTASQHNGVVTLSVGVVTRIPTADFTPAELIKAADNCLYRAKEAGRNWIVSADLTRKQFTRSTTSTQRLSGQ